MSERRIVRALARLAKGDAALRPTSGRRGFGVFAGRDRRCRALLRLSAAEVRELESQGVIELSHEDCYVLNAAGLARVAREAAAPGEAYIAQHEALVSRDVINDAGDVRTVRGLDPEVVMRKLAALRGPNGAAWLSETELAAAGKLRADWVAGEIGLVRGADWAGSPIGSAPRNGSNAQEVMMARRCDARRRVADGLARLATPLRRVVEHVCLREEGLELLERNEGWPARSGKLALKFGLAQLAAVF